jgi:hypothetical protein
MAAIAPVFDPVKYKAATREQWQAAAEAWDRWGPTLHEWLGTATELMLDIRRRAQLPPPLPGQPGPFSLGAPGVLETAFSKAGFRDIQVRVVPSPLRLPSAAECVRFERDSFGALHQMLAGVPEAERPSVWEEIEQALKTFEGADGFVGPCEMVVGVGRK